METWSAIVEQSSSPEDSPTKVSSTDWFTNEIQSMMYGFGDCKKPLLETVKLVEEIVHQQMISLLVQTADLANNRGAKQIGHEDILFLMRKDKVKLSRLLKYLEVKDAKDVIKKCTAPEADDQIKDTNDIKMPKTKRIKLCMDFLSSIDETGELSSIFEDEIFDEIKYARNIRHNQRTLCFDQAQYLEYAQARQASFARKLYGFKFKEWLLKDDVTELKPTNFAFELFNYLAYETVAQIVDLALLVKQDLKCDPLDRLEPALVCNTEYPSIQLTAYNLDSPSATPESPTQMSVSSPTSPAPQTAQPSNITTDQFSSSSKTKGPEKATSDDYKSFTYNCITPDDIREVIRRYWRPTGPLLCFSKVYHSDMDSILLCC